MRELSDEELIQIGREAATRVPDLGPIEDVDVVTRLDSSDKPAHYFTFLVHHDSAQRVLGLPLVRLGLALREELMDRDDDRFPYVRVLTHEDWGKRLGA